MQSFKATRTGRRLLIGLATIGVSFWPLEIGAPAIGAPTDGGKPPKTLSITQIEKALADHLSKQPEYRAGDLLTKSDVTSALDRLEQLGWQPQDRDAVLAGVLADNDFLAAELRTADGRKFMRKISGYPQAYDRLDRLARLPQGKRTVQDLISGAGGYKMIEYLTTASGGKELGKQLSDTPKGAKFNQPTGKIYTADDLARVLKRDYDRQAPAASGP